MLARSLLAFASSTADDDQFRRHTGIKCYLKGGIRKEGYIRTRRPTNRTAVKLSKKADPHVT